jgi:spore coat polysaccharide biosynthesis predicted glycosyltransferase SpsG
LSKIFPSDWFKKIEFVSGKSDDFFSKNIDRFDLVYIDGDHRYEAVKNDWKNTEKVFNKIVIFDDYHLPSKKSKDIECADAIDEIQGYNKELVIMDRRIFLDDRGYSDDEIDYGQVILTKKD